MKKLLTIILFSLVCSLQSQAYITRPGEKKESNLEKEIQAFKDAELKFTADPDFKKMIKTAFEDSAKNGSLLLITGSFYLVAEAKSFIDKLSE